MTVSSTTNTVVYTGSGVGPYDFTFRIFANTDLVVTKYTIADGTEVTMALTTDYTVTIDGVSGGSVTLVASLSSSYKLIIQRVLPLTQTADYVANDPFPAETHEIVADRSVMLSQQLKEEVDRTPKLDATQTGVSTTLPIPEASKVIGWNSGATGFENYDNPTAAQAAAEVAQVAAELAETNAETAETNAEAAAVSAVAAAALLEAQTLAVNVVTNHVSTNRALAFVFLVNATEDFTLDNPTNCEDGQRIIWRIKQDATGSRVITLDTKFTVASEISSIVLSTAANAIDHIGAIYNATDDKFEVVAFASEQA